MWRGNLVRARDHLERAATIYNRDLDRYLPMPRAGVIPGRSQLAWTLWALGYPEKARTRIREALSLARKLNRPYNMAFALQFAIAAEALCGDYAQIRGQSEALIELSQQHGYPHWLASGKMSLGASIVEEEDFDRGIALMREGMAGTREYGTLPVYRYGLVLMASTFLRAGNVEEGLRAVDEAAEGIEADERFNEAEIWRLRGEFMLAKRQERAAAENFRRAIGVARAQQGKSWELRATFSLAKMLASQDHAAQADAILAPVYQWFTEGFDTNDLVLAKTLLDRLRVEQPRR
jgi:predicted ATPase